MIDLLIKNGYVVDGTGREVFKGDVGIKNDRIIKIGNLKNEIAEKIIDAEGLWVSPGFIDIHSHTDWFIFEAMKSENKIRQGVTTEIVGQCGESAFPVVSEKAKDILDYFKDFYGDKFNISWEKGSEYYEKVMEKGLPNNIGALIGHGSIRKNVMGYEDRKPTEEEMAQMKELVKDEMENGAFGLSSGLPYSPGCFADTNEITELCKVVSKYNGVYTTHLRNQGNKLIEAIEEAIEIGKSSGAKVDISHLKAIDSPNWGKVSKAIDIIEDTRINGLNIICDFYPYTAAANPLITEFPKWSQEGGSDKFIERVSCKKTREKVRVDMYDENDELWDNMIIGEVLTEKNKNLRGKSLRQIAKETNKTVFDAACDLLIEEKCIVQVIVICMSDKDVECVSRYKYAAVGSDGSAITSEEFKDYKDHPRAIGTFPAFLGRYVRDKKVTTLEDGIRRITSLPAEFIGIKDRGIITENAYADIVIFDYNKIIDKATYENPAQYSEGIEYVIVNGKLQLEKREYKEISCGRVLRRY